LLARHSPQARIYYGNPARSNPSSRIDRCSGRRIGNQAATADRLRGWPHAARPRRAGNGRRIVQRLPVRIAIVPGQAAASRLRAGMSVTPTIRVRS